MAPGQETLPAALLPTPPPQKAALPSPARSRAQLQQRGQEEKRSYQLQAERGWAAPQHRPDAIYTVRSCSWGRGEAEHSSHVPLHVEGEVVGAGESPLAEVALEGPVPRVLAVVAGQLVGAGKLPATAFPGAVVGLLACGGERGVSGHMGGGPNPPRAFTRVPLPSPASPLPSPAF